MAVSRRRFVGGIAAALGYISVGADGDVTVFDPDREWVFERAATASKSFNNPFYGWPLGLIKTKVRYLTLQYSDPDTRVAGVTSFRLENKDLVDSVVLTLANKAGLVPRGEIYVKKRDDAEAKKTTP